TFIVATLLAFRYNNPVLRTFYRVAAIWLGALSYLFLAAIFSWLSLGIVLATGAPIPSRAIVEVLYASAAVVSIWGVLSARWVRVRRIKVKLENLPQAWRGRSAVLASDLHLGHMHHRGFASRIVRKISSLRPDVIFFAGDLF